MWNNIRQFKTRQDTIIQGNTRWIKTKWDNMWQYKATKGSPRQDNTRQDDLRHYNAT